MPPPAPDGEPAPDGGPAQDGGPPPGGGPSTGGGFDEKGFLAEILDAPIPVDPDPPAPAASTCAPRTVNGPDNEAFTGPVPCLAGFCLENAPATGQLWSVAGASPGSLWAVGDGVLLHRDGERWDTACAPLAGWLLHTAFAAADADVWVAGEGTIGHLDGSTWRGTPADPLWNVFEIWGDAGEAFAAYSGVEGGILRWDGAAWAPSLSAAPYGADLSVWGDGTGRAWATHDGTLAAWDGSGWIDGVRPFNLLDVWAPQGGDPWFAGYSYRWPDWWTHDAAVATLVDGSYVALPPPGYFEASWIRGSGPDDVWVGTVDSSGGDLVRWDGAAWHVMRAEAVPGRALLVLGPAEAWLVENGHDPAVGRSVPRILRFDGTTWSESLALRAAPLAAVVTTPEGVWAAGEQGVWRLDAGRWTRVHGPLGYSVRLAADGEWVFAIAQEPGEPRTTVVAFRDGVQVLTQRWPGFPAALHAAGGHAWIATQGLTHEGVNAVVHHWDGAAWTALDTGTTMTVNDLWASGPDDLWVVGAIHPTTWTSQTGLIAHWDGAEWSRRELKDYELRAVWGAGPQDVWVSGDTAYCQKCPHVDPSPMLLRWDGARLRQVASLAFDELTGSGATDVWGVVSAMTPPYGVVLHRFDGSRWSAAARLVPPFRPHALHVGEDGTLWGVDGGRLLRRSP